MKTNKFLKWHLIIGILIVLNLFYLYAIKLAYPKPEFDDFCEKEQVVKEITNQEACLEVGGQWNEHTNRLKPVSVQEGEVVTIEDIGGYCDKNFTCSEKYEDERKDYERNVFIMLVVLGVISVVIGFLVAGTEVISTALTLGGVLTFIIASLRYWSLANDWVHLAILAIALGTLIFLGIKKFRD